MPDGNPSEVVEGRVVGGDGAAAEADALAEFRLRQRLRVHLHPALAQALALEEEYGHIGFFSDNRSGRSYEP